MSLSSSVWTARETIRPIIHSGCIGISGLAVGDGTDATTIIIIECEQAPRKDYIRASPTTTYVSMYRPNVLTTYYS